MLKLIVLAIATLQLSEAFNVDGWVKRHCVTNKKVDYPIENSANFYCENVSFTKQELDDIQRGGFLISSNKRIIFEGGDIGTLNKQLLMKFPRCEELILHDVKVKLDASTDRTNHPLSSIVVNGCTVSGNKDSILFKLLPNLKKLTLFNNLFDHKILDKDLLGENSKIIELSISHNNFEKVSDDAFSGLKNMETLSIGAGMEQLQPQLLAANKKLITLSLSGNKFHQIPCDGIPQGIEILDLSDNQIKQPSYEKCDMLKSVRNLDLSNNGIEYLNADAFDPLEFVEEINLSGNKLNFFTKAHVQNLKYLKKINLSGNRIRSTDIKGKVVVVL